MREGEIPLDSHKLISKAKSISGKVCNRTDWSIFITIQYKIWKENEIEN